MSHASTHLRSTFLAVVLALGLALTAVGGTMAQEERDSHHNHDFEFTTVLDDGNTTNDLRGKVLRISVNEDEAGDSDNQYLRYEWDFDADGPVD